MVLLNSGSNDYGRLFVLVMDTLSTVSFYQSVKLVWHFYYELGLKNKDVLFWIVDLPTTKQRIFNWPIQTGVWIKQMNTCKLILRIVTGKWTFENNINHCIFKASSWQKQSLREAHCPELKETVLDVSITRMNNRQQSFLAFCYYLSNNVSFKQFLFKHFAEKWKPLWRTVAKLQCRKLCVIFLDRPEY